MKAHPSDLKMSAELNPEAFMDGVALFDKMLAEADRLARSRKDYASMYLRAEDRYWLEPALRPADVQPMPLSFYLLPLLQCAIERPQMLPGLAAALGDYLGLIQTGLVPGDGEQNVGLQFDEVWLDRSEHASAPNNVVQFAPRPARATR